MTPAIANGLVVAVIVAITVKANNKLIGNQICLRYLNISVIGSIQGYTRLYLII